MDTDLRIDVIEIITRIKYTCIHIVICHDENSETLQEEY